MRQFNPHASQSARALQAWQILVCKAANRQTITYEALSELMFGKSAAGVLGQILGHVAFLCMDNDLPALTSIVVGKFRGAPGDEFPLDPATIDVEREKVYRHDWYNIYPPTENELSKAYSEHSN